jgi:hypothetical protein
MDQISRANSVLRGAIERSTDGILVAANRERVVIERTDPAVGTVHVHFPRTGYLVFKA